MIQALYLVALFGLTTYLLNQVRKPSKWLGRLFLKDMSRRHAALTDWGLGHVSIGPQLAILDVGCGGGRTLAKLAALAPRARVVGIDYAPGSIAESQAYNRALIAAGRVEVKRAAVDQLPEPTGRFDLAAAIETHYYWPDVAAGCREIRRVLRDGGSLILVAESYREGARGRLAALALAPLRAAVLTVEEHRKRLLAAGFETVRVTTDPRRGWLCAVATAPAATGTRVEPRRPIDPPNE
jgi:SAM-dependent methyltransferase